jgi:hypothetical protein
MAVATSTARTGTTGCDVPRTSTGPIFAESCESSEAAIDVYLLTRGEVAAVSIAGGRTIPTRANPTLPDGLRAAAIELIRHNGQPGLKFQLGCPPVTPLDARGAAIHRRGKRGAPLAMTLPGTEGWEVPSEASAQVCAGPADKSRRACRLPQASPSGACELTATRLPAEITPRWGTVATQIRAYPNLLGHAFLSCVDTFYFYLGEHALDAAVLLDAAHPGATPPPLPEMKPLPGHPGFFQAPASEGEIAARRIPGAWLVVEENDEIGLSVPVELLESLQAAIKGRE